MPASFEPIFKPRAGEEQLRSTSLPNLPSRANSNNF